MVNFIVESQKVNITDAVIVSFEKNIAYKLPEDYRDYLKTYNGASPKQNYFYISKEVGESLVHDLYGFCQPSYKDIEWKYSNFKSFENMQGFLAIGSDEGGNQITLNLTDNSIHFIGMDQGFNIAIRIAKSFTEFINSLYTAPYRDELDEIFKVGTLAMFQNFINRNKAILDQKDDLGSTILESSVIHIRSDFVDYLIPFFGNEAIEVALNRAIRNSEFFDGYKPIIQSLKNKLNS